LFVEDRVVNGALLARGEFTWLALAHDVDNVNLLIKCEYTRVMVHGGDVHSAWYARPSGVESP
jgi:hypothetical protein